MLDLVRLPRFVPTVLVVAIVACWVAARFFVPDDPNAKWAPDAKMTVTLVVAGFVGSLILVLCSGLVWFRGVDVCRNYKPDMGPFSIHRSVNPLTGTVNCKLGRDGQVQVIKVPFSEFL